MLMSSYKSSADLGITEPQRQALIKTLALMETGKIRHYEVDDYAEYTPTIKRKFRGLFNMDGWQANYEECGTVACIGGTAEMIGKVSFNLSPPRVALGGLNTSLPLFQLFYPSCLPVSYYEITVAQAATALRSYLTIGDPRWDLAIPGVVKASGEGMR